MRRGFVGLVGVLGAVLSWQLLAGEPIRLSGLPEPIPVFHGLVDALGGGQLWAATWHTFSMTAVATILATVLGFFVGTLVGMSRRAGQYLGFTINSVRFVPPVAFIPVVLLLFGFGATSEIVLGVTAALWPILLNVATAVREIHDRYDDLARIERVGRVGRIVKIYLPGAVGATVVGIRLAAALALILVVAAEMLAVSSGLGHQIRFLGDALRLPEMYAYILWTGILGFGINAVLTGGRRVAAPWTT